jgi:hypothetical protein
MKTLKELRTFLDALPRPLIMHGHIQIVGGEGANRQYYTVGVWQDAREALFMLQYMQEEREK